MNPKTKLFLLLIVLFIASLSVTGCRRLQRLTAKTAACGLMSESDAENILGESVHRSNENIEIDHTLRITRCAYSTNAKDSAGIEKADIFFTLSQNEAENTDWAKSIMDFYRRENINNDPETLTNVGQDAFYYEGESYGIDHFIWARKNNSVFRIQVTSNYRTISVDELKKTAKAIADQL